VSGKRVIIAFLAFGVVFAAALTYFQLFAFYERTEAPEALDVGDDRVPVEDWNGIDAATSPLKLRACFETEATALAEAEPAAEATPLTAPFWFRCFDARGLTHDLAAGRAEAYPVTRDEPDGFDTMLAVYPDGRAYLWRQLNERFR
jgi:hypothetical protein